MQDETDSGWELQARRKSEEEAREMITPALREALTKQGGAGGGRHGPGRWRLRVRGPEARGVRPGRRSPDFELDWGGLSASGFTGTV